MASSVLSRYIDADVLTRIEHHAFEPRQLVLGNLAGAHKSPLSGFAVEFAGHREYVVGDDPKHVDWRVFFKRDKYVVKQYEMETNLVCHLVVDVSASMRYGAGVQQKLRWAQEATATLGYAIIRQSDRVSLTSFDEKVLDHVPASNSMAQVERIARHFDAIEPVKKTNMADCLNDMAGRTGRREIVLIFSDFFTDVDALEASLQRLRYKRHEVVLFHVLHRDELEFDMKGMIKFVGLEGARDVLTNPPDVRRRYLAALKEYRGKLEDACARNRVEHVLVDTSHSLAETLSDYLHRRSLLQRGR